MLDVLVRILRTRIAAANTFRKFWPPILAVLNPAILSLKVVNLG